MIVSLAGCGTEPSSNQPAKSPATVRPSDASQGANTLTVSVKASAQAPAKTWTVNCDTAQGNHPKAKQACDTLAKVQDPFKPTPPGQMCTKIYGGPEVATVKGTWRNQPVNATFSRGDGCELHRWSKIGPLFGDVPKVR